MRKKLTKSQEIAKESDNNADEEMKKEDDAANEDIDTSVEKKDKVAISCPLCGHISHSKVGKYSTH